MWKFIRKTAFLPLLTMLLTLLSCFNIASVYIGKIVKPEEAKHYNPSGALVALSVEKTRQPGMTSFMMLMDNAPTYSVFTPGEKNYVILDIPFACRGIVRTGAMLGVQGIDQWFYNNCQFTLESNKLNYLGRFIFEKDLSIQEWDKMIVTNTLAEDKEWLYEYYPALTNLELVVVPVTNGRFRVR